MAEGLTLSKTSRELGHALKEAACEGKWAGRSAERTKGAKNNEDGYNKRLWLSERRRLMIVALGVGKRIVLDI